jgi:hypothetical protein
MSVPVEFQQVSGEFNKVARANFPVKGVAATGIFRSSEEN